MLRPYPYHLRRYPDQLRPYPYHLRPYPYRHPRRAQHLRRLRAAHDRAHRRERGNVTVVERRRAAHHDRLDAATPAGEAAHQSAQLGLALVRDGAGVDHGQVGGGGVVHDRGARALECPAHERRVVLVRLTTESVEVDVHGRTVRPTSTVHTRSVSPVPRRSSRSTPRSIEARPCANERPVPAAAANSVGAVVPGPNGIWPPRTPSRKGIRLDPNSAPPDQLQVLNAPGPERDQDRQATDPPNFTLGLGANRMPPPAPCGRSVSAVVLSPVLARKRLSDRAQPATESPGATPIRMLPEMPKPL